MTSENKDKEFKTVIADNYERVYNVIYRMISDPEEAADLTQETFVNAYRSWDSFRGDSQVYTWLYRIAVNLTKNRLERRGRINETEAYSLDAPVDDDEDGDLYLQVDDETMAPERLADNQELKEVLVEEVESLRHDYKEVIILRDYQDFAYKEIAEILDCTVQAVKSRLFRARSTLRERLQDYLKEKI